MKEENLKKRYLVILADRKKTRFFTIYLGRFEDKGQEIDREDVPQMIKTEGYRPGKIQKHIDEHLRRHLKNVGAQAMEYLIARKIRQLDGVFIGTHKSLFGDLQKSLPPKLKHKFLGEFVIEPNAALGDITDKVISKFKL